MARIFVISDTHWGHANIIRYCNRPFADVRRMDMEMLDRWNDTVRDDDIVYHLGDVGRVPGNLRGRKRLLLGNHDDWKKNKLLSATFSKVGVTRLFKEFDCILSHYPLHDSSLYKCKYNVHGHIHEKTLDDPRYINASVEHTNYTPILLEDLVSRHAATTTASKNSHS